MNFKKILWVSLLVLVISTYQTDSGLIFGLLLKMLMLKGALFMSMPIAIGAFMMGQGMGFFAGNMMGGYMMLRAANRYHTKEKTKWMSYSGYHHQPKYTGWGSPHYQKGFHSAKAVFKAIDHLNYAKLHALNKAKAAIHGVHSKVKGIKSVVHSKAKGIKSAIHGNIEGNYGFELNTGDKGWSNVPSKGYIKTHAYGNTYEHGDGGYLGHSHGHDHGYSPGAGGYGHGSGVHSHGGYSHGSGGYSPGSGGHSAGWGSSGSHNHEYAYGASEEFKEKPYAFKELPSEYQQTPASLEYHHHDTSGGLGTDAGYDYSAGSFDTNSEYSSHSPALTKWKSPSNSFYTSAYAGPGQEYTGLLTQGGSTSIEKSAEGVDDDEGSESQQSFSTAEAPNEVIEQYLETRLKEEAKKVKDVEQKKEAQQLIQLLRKAYLKQLVDSLKTEEEELKTITSSTPAAVSSKESRSLSGMDSLEYIKYLVGLSEKDSKDSVVAEKHTQVSTPKSYVSSSTKSVPVSSTFATTTKATPTTSSTEKSTTERVVIVNSTTVKSILKKYKKPKTESPLFKDTTVEFSDVNPEIAAMWVKSESTYVDEKSPFVLRLKREAAEATPEEKQVKAFVDDIKRFFTLLSVLDQDQCLQKLVCDVHTKPSSEIVKLGDYEKNIITTFKLMKAMLPENEEDSTTKYRKAALIGETGLSTDICKAAYSACTFSSSQIITLGTQVEKTPGDWTETSTETSTEKSASRRSDYVTAMPRVRRRVLEP